ncbi:MAG: AraC family ligand binding domain-containing protein [Candidatus Angelobacter sp.]
MTSGHSSINTGSGVSSLDLASELAGSRDHKPWQSGLYSKLLLKADDLRLVLIAMETGARLKEHHVDGTVSIHALEGTVCIHAQTQAQDLHAGQILTLAPGIKHDVEAREDSAFLLTISWPSSEKLESMSHRGYGS